MTLERWLAASGRGEPVWLADVREASAAMPDAYRLTARLLRLDGQTRDFAIPLPRWRTPAQRAFVQKYLNDCIFNILSVHGGRRMELLTDLPAPDVEGLLRQLPVTFQLAQSRREGYGKAVSVADRLCHAFGDGDFSLRWTEPSLPPPLPAAVRASDLPQRLLAAVERGARGLACGVDVGGTDVKLALARDGRLLCVRVLDWNPAASRTAEGIIGPLTELVGRAVEDFAPGEKLDALGISFPDVVIRDRIVGGETPKTQGMRRYAQDYEAEFAKLTALRERFAPFCRPDAPVRIINDGHMAAFTAAVEMACAGQGGRLCGGVAAHTLGTDLGTGWLDADGRIPEAPMELYDLLLDLGSGPACALPAEELRSVRNENSGLPGLRRYTGQAAAFRLAWQYAPDLLDGFTVCKDGLLRVSESPDLRKPCLAHLMDQAGRGNAAAQRVFFQIGSHLGQVCREEQWLLHPQTDVRFLMGRFVRQAACFEQIRLGCAATAPWIRLEAVDEDMACSPLMKQLAGQGRGQVAQFGQAVGAVYYALMG